MQRSIGVLILSAAIGSILACCRPPQSSARSEPRSSSGTGAASPGDAAVARSDASTAGDSGADAGDLLEDPARNWSDPRLIALLARDCDASYPSPPDPGEDSTDEAARDRFDNWRDPLACSADFIEQSCSYDPCSEGETDPCKGRCVGQCDDCRGRCRASCGACRASCVDDACRLRCATQCAECLDGCVGARDRCGGACAREYAACTQRTVAAYVRSCRAPCASCQRACPDDNMQCVTRCLARRFARACTEQQRNICAWHGTHYGEE